MLRSWNSSRTTVVKSDSSGSCWSRAVRIPSVAKRTRVSAVNLRSNRTCQPTSRPSVQPRSSAIRRAIARAATRRDCSTITGPSAASAGGTRVVLPAPGAAERISARRDRAAARISGMKSSIGRGVTGQTEYSARDFRLKAETTGEREAERSFGSERDRRIDAQRAPHGDPVGEQCDNRQHHRGGGERRGIHRADSEHERSEIPRGHERGGKARGHTDRDELAPAAQNQPHDVAAPGAERDAYADLARALRYAVRHHAVESNRREQHRNAGKRGQ